MWSARPTCSTGSSSNTRNSGEMSSPPRPKEDPGLFDDLPLHQDTRVEDPDRKVDQPRDTPSPAKPPGESAEALPLFADTPGTEPTSPAASAEFFDATTRPAWRPVVPVPAQLSAGLIDLGLILAVGLMTWLGLYFMGISIDLVDWGIVALFLLPFSFLYEVFPLAFWGRTPGMERVGLVARSRDGKSLSFSQAARRWLAAVITVCLLGLPWILTATTGKSLADRLSGSQTLPAR
jgi:uncharacterized RDD family membrane protein YckC